MSKKYLVKTLTIKCSYCGGKGSVFVDISPCNFNCNCDKTCSKCKGMGFITITPKDTRFKERYAQFVKKEVERLTEQYREAKEFAGQLGNELGKYCKEYDKLINKK